MVKNVSLGDRIARIVFGMAGLATALVDPLSPWMFLGIILWATGIAGWCPLYALFGLSPGKNCK